MREEIFENKQLAISNWQLAKAKPKTPKAYDPLLNDGIGWDDVGMALGSSSGCGRDDLGMNWDEWGGGYP
jgi:hypothetical protein